VVSVRPWLHPFAAAVVADLVPWKRESRPMAKQMPRMMSYWQELLHALIMISNSRQIYQVAMQNLLIPASI
jgi:hypothetical protein